METVTDFILGGSKITVDGDCSHEIQRRLLHGRKVMTHLDSMLKKQRHYFSNKGPSSQGYGFSRSHLWMLDYKEGWALKNWCFWTVVLEKTLEGPLNCKIKPVNPKRILKEISPEYSLECLRLKLKLQNFGQELCKELTLWKIPWCWERLKAGGEGMTEDQMVGWHYWVGGLEFDQALGVGWWTAKPVVLQSMGLQRVGHDWVTELNIYIYIYIYIYTHSYLFCFSENFD